MRRLVWCAIALSVATGCMRVDVTDVRVRDPRALGVVADRNNEWLLPPYGPPETKEIARNIGGTATLTREPSGAVSYTSRHWALGTRVDTTQLFSPQGRWTFLSTPADSERLQAAIERGGEVRLHPVERVVATGRFGFCNGTDFGSCSASPVVHMSIATDSRDVETVHVVRTRIKLFGAGEVVLGAVSIAFGSIDAGFLLPTPDNEIRNVIIGVGAGLVVLGGLVVANGLWRLLSPDQTFTYQGSRGP